MEIVVGRPGGDSGTGGHGVGVEYPGAWIDRPHGLLSGEDETSTTGIRIPALGHH